MLNITPQNETNHPYTVFSTYSDSLVNKPAGFHITPFPTPEPITVETVEETDS